MELLPLKEEWKNVVGFEGLYQVSSLGIVRSVPKSKTFRNRWGGWNTNRSHGKVLVAKPNKWGYPIVRLTKDGETVFRSIHRLVLESFVGPRTNGMVCRHFPDRNPLNNRLDNLQWGTNQENSDDKIIHGTTLRGTKLTKEHRRKLSESHKGKKQSAEHVLKRVAAHVGMKRSLKTRLRISQALRGKTASAEARANMAAAQLGRRKSQETKDRIAEAQRERWRKRRQPQDELA